MANGFEFIGFEPTSALQDFANLRLGRIEGEAPSDAFALASIERNREGGFEAVVRINSTAGTFAAEARAEDPQVAISALSSRIRTQLRLWKRQRFEV